MRHGWTSVRRRTPDGRWMRVRKSKQARTDSKAFDREDRRGELRSRRKSGSSRLLLFQFERNSSAKNFQGRQENLSCVSAHLSFTCQQSSLVPVLLRAIS